MFLGPWERRAVRTTPDGIVGIGALAEPGVVDRDRVPDLVDSGRPGRRAKRCARRHNQTLSRVTGDSGTAALQHDDARPVEYTTRCRKQPESALSSEGRGEAQEHPC